MHAGERKKERKKERNRKKEVHVFLLLNSQVDKFKVLLLKDS